MPFTPTHIVAVLPISRVSKRLSLIALSIGAIIPDFPMFFPISTYRFSHSSVGIVGYCVPAGLLLYVFFEAIGKQFLCDACLIWVQSRLRSYRCLAVQYTLGNVFWLSLSIIIGSITHILWDAFTHSTGWGVHLIPRLAASYGILGHYVPGYKLFQYGSTLLGVPVIMFAGVLFLARITPEPPPLDQRVLSVSVTWAITLSFLGIPCLLIAYYLMQKPSLYMAFGATIITSFTATIPLFFLYSLLYWWHLQRTAVP
jgi:hypothetical protein